MSGGRWTWGGHGVQQEERAGMTKRATRDLKGPLKMSTTCRGTFSPTRRDSCLWVKHCPLFKI